MENKYFVVFTNYSVIESTELMNDQSELKDILFTIGAYKTHTQYTPYFYAYYKKGKHVNLWRYDICQYPIDDSKVYISESEDKKGSYSYWIILSLNFKNKLGENKTIILKRKPDKAPELKDIQDLFNKFSDATQTSVKLENQLFELKKRIQAIETQIEYNT